MSEAPGTRCHHCERTDDEVHLEQCPICFKQFCTEHRFQMSGRTFCSNKCAEYFFFADPEDADD